MVLKYIQQEIRILARMKQLEAISPRGEEKLKEFRYLLELHEKKIKNND